MNPLTWRGGLLDSILLQLFRSRPLTDGARGVSNTLRDGPCLRYGALSVWGLFPISRIKWWHWNRPDTKSTRVRLRTWSEILWCC